MRLLNNSMNMLSAEVTRLNSRVADMEFLFDRSLARWETFWREYVAESHGAVPELSSRRVPTNGSQTFGGGLPTNGEPTPKPPPGQKAEVEDWT